jgi:hypothetical protein
MSYAILQFRDGGDPVELSSSDMAAIERALEARSEDFEKIAVSEGATHAEAALFRGQANHSRDLVARIIRAEES